MILFILAATSPVSGQATGKNNKDDNSTQSLRSFRQIFWDSLPQPTGYVNDYENLYTDNEENLIDSLILDFEKRTTIQMAVITFDTTMTTKDSLEALTLRIAKFWGVGQKEKNNGVVIGICRGYRQVRIQNGYGIEKILTDRETKEIIDNAFIPGFREGNYFDGTVNGLKTLMTTLIRNSKEKPKVSFSRFLGKTKTACSMSVCNMTADGRHFRSNFSIKHYIFNQGDDNSTAATSQTL